jgi:uncharacterized membrane protein YfcA
MLNATSIIILIIIGLAAGFFGGMVGLGGGVIMIPAMVFFLGMTQQAAQGTSLAVMLPPVGIMAVLNYYKAGQMDLRYAAIIAATFIIGGYFGSKLALGIPVAILKRIFGIALLIIALQMIIKK